MDTSIFEPGELPSGPDATYSKSEVTISNDRISADCEQELHLISYLWLNMSIRFSGSN